MKERYRAETALDQLTEKSISWLNDNYHKFSQTNKIKISLEIIKRKLPTVLTGSIAHTHFFEEIVSKSDRPNLFADAPSTN